MRKKAKYLHDAPLDDAPAEFAPQPAVPPPSAYTTYTLPPHSAAAEMLPPDGTINPNSIESPGGPADYGPAPGNPGGAPMFDPADPALFNFDIANLNFSNHYGALEFGVLGQMSNQAPNGGGTGGAGTPDNSGAGSNYAYSPGMNPDGYVGFTAPQELDQWGNVTARATTGRDSGFAGTYMIEAGPGSLTSPSPPVESPRQNYDQPAVTRGGYPETSSGLGSPNFFTTHPAVSRAPNHNTLAPPHPLPQQQQHQVQHQQRRRRLPDDPSSIYSSITQPYPYALQHHRLFHMLETRFSKPLLLRIARSMASFRPSFIACTQTLKADDLLFMEKCFQRTLWEYERFIQSCGTPTLVCRRTGEVVGVGKEFCMLTGWERAVLLGEKPNRNVNRPFADPSSSSSPTGSRDQQHLHPHQQQQQRRPLVPEPEEQVGVRKPVFLAELLDDMSVVEFYEQFARLAFGDSRGAVMTRAKVLTYKPGDPSTGGAKHDDADDERDPITNNTTSRSGAGGGGVGGGGAGGGAQPPRKRERGGMEGLGEDGKVECAFCWTIKRDVFDIPMLIVGNVSFLSSLPALFNSLPTFYLRRMDE